MKPAVKKVGWDEAQRRIWQRLSRFGPAGMVQALEYVGQGVVAQYRQNIEAGRSPAGKFKALSEPYATRKAALWGEQPILVASGSMRASLVYDITQRGTNRYLLRCGSNDSSDDEGVKNADKAGWHIEGTPRMPSRDFGALPKRLIAQLQSKALTEILRTR